MLSVNISRDMLRYTGDIKNWPSGVFTRVGLSADESIIIKHNSLHVEGVLLQAREGSIPYIVMSTSEVYQRVPDHAEINYSCRFRTSAINEDED